MRLWASSSISAARGPRLRVDLFSSPSSSRLHSALLRWTSAQLFGVDYPWYFQTGVANQYLLGAGLQPSVFGVFLVLSIHAFLKGRPLLAVTCSSLAAVMHSTYLLSAAFLTLAYLFFLLRTERLRWVVLVGLWALLLVTPALVYNLGTFATSPDTFADSQRLLRISAFLIMPRWTTGWTESPRRKSAGWYSGSAWPPLAASLSSCPCVSFCR